MFYVLFFVGMIGMMDPNYSIFDDPTPVGEDGAWGEIRLDTNMSG